MADEVAVPVRGALRRAKLHRPATRTYGTIVFVHGSGEATVDDFAWYTDQLTDLGIACLVVDKVMDGYTQTRRHFDALADDAGDALRWARQQPDLHDAPAGLLGYSEGSWIAATAAARYPDLVDLVALCSAPLARPRSQTSYHWANLDPSRPRAVRVLRRALMWTAMTAFTDYGNYDITEALRTIPVPVILVLGADDPTVDVELACRIFDQTRHSSPPPIIVPGADHALPPDSDWINQVGVTLTTGRR
jgi:alpha-beta hydrolase superfamily lysophospholipase